MKARPSADEVVVALLGQPNCGKSTLFNAVAGFKVNTGNFAGTSVTFTETSLDFGGRAIRLVDLPGTYSLSSHDPAEEVARDYLLSGEVDVVINVADASMLSRSLELTLQLIETGIPMVLCLNMADEAHRKGIEIDEAKLAALTGVPVRTAVAVVGTGIDDLFRLALEQVGRAPVNAPPAYTRDIEESIAQLVAQAPALGGDEGLLSPRFVVLKLLELDGEIEERVAGIAAPGFIDAVRAERRKLADKHSVAEADLLSSHRHALVLDLYEKVAAHRHGPTLGRRERIDRFITNPLGGFVTVIGSLLLAFYVAFVLGDAAATLLDRPFTALRDATATLAPGIGATLLSGLVDGFIAGAGIVLPYLVPLLVLLAVYEDTGLLPRIAFLVDGILHRVGLHGKSVVPLILGFGCNVPAIMATRNLENGRDRFITMLVIPFATCSARSVVILALAGKYLGALPAVALYLFGIAIAMLVAFTVSRVKRRRSLGLIMEVPPLRPPYPRLIAKKVWFRLREFLVVAWPVILVSSVVLAVLSAVGVAPLINRALSPLTTSLLGLPEVTGIALFLGLFRKELTLVMLTAALGTAHVGAVLSQSQILVLVVFTMLYVPCVATLAALWKEGGWKTCVTSVVLNFGVAVAVATAFALVASLSR